MPSSVREPQCRISTGQTIRWTSTSEQNKEHDAHSRAATTATVLAASNALYYTKLNIAHVIAFKNMYQMRATCVRSSASEDQRKCGGKAYVKLQPNGVLLVAALRIFSFPPPCSRRVHSLVQVQEPKAVQHRLFAQKERIQERLTSEQGLLQTARTARPPPQG